MKRTLLMILLGAAASACVADTTITHLPAASGVTSDDLTVVVDNPSGAATTKKATAAQVATFVLSADPEISALAALSSAADKLPYFTGVGAASLADFSAFARSLVASANATAARATLGLAIGTNVEAWDADLDAIAALVPSNDDVIQRKAGAWINRSPGQLKVDLALSKADVGLGNVENTALSTWPGSSNLTTLGTVTAGNWNAGVIGVGFGGTSASTAAGARTNLGLAIGSNVEAWDADLDALAGLASAADKLPYFTGASTAALTTFTSFARSLLDDPDAATARTTIGLGNVENTALSTWAGSSNLTTLGTVATGTWNATPISLSKGGTGVSLSNPGGDRILYWDNGATTISWLTVGSGLSLAGGVISATGGGGGTGAPVGATYITQIHDTDLTNEQALSDLATGLLKNTATTGVLSIATEGTDYYKPGGTDVALADGGTGASNAVGARSNLGLVIGANVEAWDADLDTWATKTAPSGAAVGTTDIQTLTNKTISGASNTLTVRLDADVTNRLPYANLTQGSALSVLGVAGNASADVASLSASADGQVLRRSGTTLGFGAVNLGSSNAVTGSLLLGNGGLGITSGNSGGVPYFNTTSSVASSGALTANAVMVGGGAGGAPATIASTGTTTTVLHGNASGGPSFGAVSLTTDVSGTLPVGSGGTGLSSAADDQTIVNNGSGWQAKSLPACADSGGNHLNYDTSTNTFSCGTTSNGLVSFNGARVKKSSSQTLTQNSGITSVTWQTEPIDVGGWHDTSSNTERLTVPSGVSYVQLHGSVSLSLASVTGNMQVRLEIRHFNSGSSLTTEDAATTVWQTSPSAGNVIDLQVASGPIAVATGDYFFMTIETVGTGSVSHTIEASGSSGQSVPYFSIQAIG